MSCAGVDTCPEKLSFSGLKDVISVYTCQHQQWRQEEEMKSVVRLGPCSADTEDRGALV